MNIMPAIVPQYHATLEMPRPASVVCTDELWNNASQTDRFWQFTYHVLFYARICTQLSETKT